MTGALGALRLWRDHAALSMTDACIVANALSVGAEFLTFDDDQRAAVA